MLEVLSSESILEAGSRQVESLCWRLVVHRLGVHVNSWESTGWESLLETGSPQVGSLCWRLVVHWLGVFVGGWLLPTG